MTSQKQLIKRILFLTPPNASQGFNDLSSNESIPPLGIAYIITVAKLAGYEVKFIDCSASNMGIKDALQAFERFAPDVLAISAYTVQIKMAYQLASRAKLIRPGLVTVVGGSHASALPKETALEFPDFDFVVSGEGENAFLSILEALAANDLSLVRSSAFRERLTGEIVLARAADPVDIDSLPVPAWEEFDLSLYSGYISNFKRRTPLSIYTARGCPFNCIFCYNTMGRHVRPRSVASVINEIRSDVERFGADYIAFSDETFTFDRKRTSEFCRALIDAGLHRKIEWMCAARVDTVDEELLALMKKAGCTFISFGIESGDPQILSAMKKGFGPQEARRALAVTKKLGIQTRANIIFGFPGETAESMMRSIDFVLEIDPDTLALAILVPFPGTQVYKWAQNGENGLRFASKDWDDFGKHKGSALELDSISRAELERYQRLGYMKFYLRPGKIMRLLEIIRFRSVPAYLLNNIKHILLSASVTKGE
jgi:anaerobic magnesium-protoporphyrin IX monomethyl ester cyclase